MVTAKALEPLESLERMNNTGVKVEASAGSASAASAGKENSAGWKSGDRKDHVRTSSLSNLDNLLEGEEVVVIGKVKGQHGAGRGGLDVVEQLRVPRFRIERPRH